MRLYTLAFILASLTRIAHSAPIMVKPIGHSFETHPESDSSGILGDDDDKASPEILDNGGDGGGVNKLAIIIPSVIGGTLFLAGMWRYYKMTSDAAKWNAELAAGIAKAQANAWKAYDAEVSKAIEGKYRALFADLKDRVALAPGTTKQQLQTYAENLQTLYTNERVDFKVQSFKAMQQKKPPPVPGTADYIADHAANLYTKHPELAQIHNDGMMPRLTSTDVIYEWPEQTVGENIQKLMAAKAKARPSLKDLRVDARAAEAEATRLKLKWKNAIPTSGSKPNAALGKTPLPENMQPVALDNLKQDIETDYFPKLKAKDNLPDNYLESWNTYDAARTESIHNKYAAIQRDFETKYPEVDSSQFLDVLSDEKFKELDAYWQESSLRTQAELPAANTYASDEADRVFTESGAARDAVVDGLKRKVDAYTAGMANRDPAAPNFLKTEQYNDISNSVDEETVTAVTSAVSSTPELSKIWKAIIDRDGAGILQPLDAAAAPISAADAFRVKDDFVTVPSNSEVDFHNSAGELDKQTLDAIAEANEKNAASELDKLIKDNHFEKSADEMAEDAAREALEHL